MNKYKVIAVAYRDIEETIKKRICKYSAKDIFSMKDLENISEFCGRGFNMNDRICIYLDWFKEDFKKKLKDGYNISLIEMPYKKGNYQSDFLGFLDEEYGEELIVIATADV